MKSDQAGEYRETMGVMGENGKKVLERFPAKSFSVYQDAALKQHNGALNFDWRTKLRNQSHVNTSCIQYNSMQFNFEEEDVLVI